MMAASAVFGIVFLCVLVSVSNGECPMPRKIFLALLQPLEGELGFEQTAAASTMAVRAAQNKGILNGTEVM